MEDINRRLHILRGNTSDVSPANTQNKQIREREREISNIPKGIVNNRKSSTIFNFPDTPPKHLVEGQIEENSMRTRIFLLRHIFLN